MSAFNSTLTWHVKRYAIVIFTMLSRGLGLALLFLAVGASRGAEPLLRTSRRRPRQERRASRLQSRLLALLAQLQLRHTDPLYTRNGRPRRSAIAEHFADTLGALYASEFC